MTEEGLALVALFGALVDENAAAIAAQEVRLQEAAAFLGLGAIDAGGPVLASGTTRAATAPESQVRTLPVSLPKRISGAFGTLQ